MSTHWKGRLASGYNYRLIHTFSCCCYCILHVTMCSVQAPEAQIQPYVFLLLIRKQSISSQHSCWNRKVVIPNIVKSNVSCGTLRFSLIGTKELSPTHKKTTTFPCSTKFYIWHLSWSHCPDIRQTPLVHQAARQRGVICLYGTHFRRSGVQQWDCVWWCETCMQQLSHESAFIKSAKLTFCVDVTPKFGTLFFFPWSPALCLSPYTIFFKLKGQN